MFRRRSIRKASKPVCADLPQSSQRRDLALVAATGAAALFASPAKAQPVPPPPRPGAAGRAFVNFIGDGISLSDAQVSPQVQYDGKEGFFVTNLSNASATFAVSGPTFTASITQGQKVLTLASSSTKWYPQPEDVGQKIAIAGAGASGGVLLSTIASVDYQNDDETLTTVLLADPAGTTLSAAAGTLVMWPYFEASDVGKGIWISQGGAPSLQGFTNTVGAANNGNGPLLTTIAAYVAYNSITLIATPGSNVGSDCLRMVWGTDNTAAIIAARTVGAGTGARHAHYESANPAVPAPGRTYPSQARCCAFSFLSGNASADRDALDNMIHCGNGVASFFTDVLGNIMRTQIIPRQAWDRAPPTPPRRLSARQHLLCSASAATIIQAITGDSMGLDDPLGGSADSFSQATKLLQRLRWANGGRTVVEAPYNYALGGATWQQLNGNWFSQTWPNLPPYYVADETQNWLHWPAAASPTLVWLAINAGNDRQFIHQQSMQACIVTVQNSFTKVNGRAPDIGLVTNREWSAPGSGGTLNFVDFDGMEKASMLHRSMARMQNLACLDYHADHHFKMFGWSPTHMKLSLVPFSVTATIAAGVLAGMGHMMRDFGAAVVLGNSQAGAAVWALAPFAFKIGNHPQNIVRFSIDATSTWLQFRAHTWGFEAGLGGDPQASITLANNSAALSVAAPTTVSGVTWVSAVQDTVTGGTLITTSGFSWPTAVVGQALIIPGGQFTWSGAPTDTGNLRTQIIGRPSSNSILVADVLPLTGVGTNQWSSTCYYGPMLFVPTDAGALSDCVVNDGTTTLTTKISGYTSMTAVTLAANWTGTSRSGFSANLFVGRICIPLTTCNGSNGTQAIAAGTGLATGPLLRVSAVSDQLEITYLPYFNTYSVSATVSISSSSPNLSSTTAIFEAGMVGQAIQVPGAGTAGGNLQAYIKTFTDSQHVVLDRNASTTLTSQTKTIAIAAAQSSAAGGQNYPMIVYRGPVERYGGQFIPGMMALGSSLKVQYQTANQRMGIPEYYGPSMVAYEAWGTPDLNYAGGGAGGTHNNAYQAAIVDTAVLDAQDWDLGPLPPAYTETKVTSATAPGSTSAFTMQGLAASITPTRSGVVQVTISGNIVNSSGTAGIGLKYQVSYGAGTAPSNAASLTGTQVGQVQGWNNPAALTAADVLVPFSITAPFAGNVGITYWVDLAAEAIGTISDASLANVEIVCMEKA